MCSCQIICFMSDVSPDGVVAGVYTGGNGG